jgi:cobalt-zinc-cadmium efflux system protein
MSAQSNHMTGEFKASSRMMLSLIITLAFVVVEIIAGLSANSLALLTDAAHNVTDVLAIGLSWYALHLATRGAHSGRTYGYHRAGILAAFINSTTLALISIGIFYEAIQRINQPLQVEENTLIVVSIVAFLVNLGTALLVRQGSATDLNMRSAFVHLAGDAVATFGAILAGVGIKLTHWQLLDPIASIFIGLLILRGAWGILRETIEILLEGTPRDIDVAKMIADIQRIDGVRGVHDLHVWSINHSMRALSAHVLTDDIPVSSGATIQRQINAVLVQHYGVMHATLQLECVGCDPDSLYCDLTVNDQPVKVKRE